MRPALWLLLVACPLASCATSASPGDDEPEAEDCANGYDDDDDHLVDCFDLDCAALPACAPPELCENELDDDRDGLADCADPQCVGSAACADAVEAVCDDGIDDDGDGSIDCTDVDCGSAEVCARESDALDCVAICAHEEECGTDGARDCRQQCQCTLDRLLTPEVGTAFYECRLASTCAALAQPEACTEAYADIPPSRQASNAIAQCAAREDCAGLPCELLGIIPDARVQEIEDCWFGSDCITCAENVLSSCS